MGTPVLTVRDLCFSYQGHGEALSGVNLEVCEGERIAVLGSNGAGKSTLFLNLNGVLTPDSGTIAYRARVITRKDLKELRKHVGIVFQDADNQIIASTVLAEVSFGPMNLKLPKQEVKIRVEQALDYMDLADYAARAPHYLSGGEKKRVSIADIIAMKSEVMMFDEPTAALDPVSAVMLETVLEKLSSEHKTLLISTHDVDFAYRWAERIIVFAKGRLIADGPPLQVFEDRKTLELAHLKRPVLLDVYELLVKKGIESEVLPYPRSVKEFEVMMESLPDKVDSKNIN